MAEQKVRARNFMCQRSYYFETHDENGLEKENAETAEVWKSRVRGECQSLLSDEQDQLLLIFHDKDVLPDGELKPLHVHFLLMFKNARYQQVIMRESNITRLENCQVVRARSAAARYLIHVTNEALNEGKHIYSPDEVEAYNCDFMQLIKQKASNDKEDIDEMVAKISGQLQKGELIPDEVLKILLGQLGEKIAQKVWKKYRRDFMIDFKEFVNTRAEQFKHTGRKLDVFYISGAGGTGKSQLARVLAYALSDRVHFAAAGGAKKTFDFAGTYQGFEEISVLNEISAGNFALREFLNLFDNWQYAPANSRNSDKQWLATTVIFTSSDSLDDFTRKLVYSEVDPLISYSKSEKYSNKEMYEKRRKVEDYIWQVLRRIKAEIVCEPIGFNETEYLLYILDEKSRKMMKAKSIICNDVTNENELYKVAEQIIENLVNKKPSDQRAATLADDLAF